MSFVTVCFGGIFRCIGYQGIIAVVSFVCYWIISIPLAYLMTFKTSLSIYGTRISYIIVVFLLLTTYVIIYNYKVDFIIICETSTKRLTKDNKEVKGDKRDSVDSIENL